jgi:predicted  nucleic acid-binding Zn-ribbon protein
MGYREARELARIRSELRERLMAQRHSGSEHLLARLRLAAEGDTDLRSEYERWRLRFELLAVTG